MGEAFRERSSTRAIWCAAPFLIGALTSSHARACLGGLIFELAAVIAYYLTQCLLGLEPWNELTTASLALAEAACATGLVFAPIGRSAAPDVPWRHVAQMTLPAVIAFEAGLDLTPDGFDRLPTTVCAAGLVLSCLTLLALTAALIAQIWRARPVRLFR